MSPDSIFIVDDDALVREAFEAAFSREYRVIGFETAEAALEVFSRTPPDLVLLDIGLPGITGTEALKRFREARPQVPVIMITAHQDVRTVVAAMKSGAYDYVVKPLDPNGLQVSIRNALDSIRLRKEMERLQESYLQENLPFFIGESDAIQEIMSLVAKVAKSPDASVLILGETGTGKDLIARTIHFRSPNFRGPFVSLNCSSLPDQLLESELFGYEKGAFTGAERTGKKGLIETAAGGTLFLDEIGEISPNAQAKLLRFLESGEYYKLGGVRKHSIQARVVAATNKDIEALVEADRFRRDLYYRLAAIRIEIPNLRHRRADVLPMAKYFLSVYSKKLQKPFVSISPEAVTALHNHEWKGNVRELRTLIERAVLVGSGPALTVQDLGLPLERAENRPATACGDPPGTFQPLPSEGIDLPALHQAMDLHYLRQSLDATRGNATRAAQLLQMNYFAFKRRQEKLGL
jgi:DNA-binding NtrC family response regulator